MKKTYKNKGVKRRNRKKPERKTKKKKSTRGGGDNPISMDEIELKIIEDEIQSGIENLESTEREIKNQIDHQINLLETAEKMIREKKELLNPGNDPEFDKKLQAAWKKHFPDESIIKEESINLEWLKITGDEGGQLYWDKKKKQAQPTPPVPGWRKFDWLELHKQAQQENPFEDDEGQTYSASTPPSVFKDKKGKELPEGWIMYTDEKTGDPYYYNPSTNRVQWEEPDYPVRPKADKRTLLRKRERKKKAPPVIKSTEDKKKIDIKESVIKLIRGAPDRGRDQTEAMIQFWKGMYQRELDDTDWNEIEIELKNTPRD